MVYFSPLASKLYHSLSTCQDLGLVSSAFPLSTAAASSKETPPEHSTQTRSNRPSTLRPTPKSPSNPTPALQIKPQTPPAARLPRDTRQRPCSCSTRAPPPDKPTTFPFPGTIDNRHKLERCLLDLYSASSFNVCEHQPLPLTLSIDLTATPKSFHTPIPVPIHWQDEVKAVLDRDVRLGVLEKVPLGMLVTWCHRMVICTKKMGHSGGRSTFSPSTAMPPGKPTTANHPSTRPEPFLARQRRRSLMPGTDTIRSPWQKKIATSQHLLPHGGGIATAQHPKATSLRVMPTQPGMTPSLLV